SVTFAETASGWQETDFTTPVPVAANTTYVASYHTTSGYPQDLDYFAASGVDNPPVHALKDGADGGNGVYAYDPSPGAIVFPGQSYRASNYYVDIVFNRAISVRAGLEPPVVEAATGDSVTASVAVDPGTTPGGLGG